MLEHPKVLLISHEGESSTLRMLLNEHVILTCANNLTEAYGLLKRGGYDALFCDESFDTGACNEGLAEVRKGYPDLPIIILSQLDGEQQWADLLKAGAFDLLVVPHLKRAGSAVWEQARGVSRCANYEKQWGTLEKREGVRQAWRA